MTKNSTLADCQYSGFFKKKNAAELTELSHIKRFLECYTADPQLRDSYSSQKVSLNQLAINRGIKLDNIESLRPVFDPKFAHFRAEATLDTWPLTAKWDEYFRYISRSLSHYLKMGDTDGEFKEFDEWRSRQIVRTLVEVGPSASYIVHPPIAFELSDGCSVGCWFCGVSADKFGGHFVANEIGIAEWRKTLNSVKNVLGRGMSTGFCYWATEPLDNPDYIEFIKIYKDVVGVTPQTTTAIPLRNVNLTREVLKVWDEDKYVPNRFSVLSLQTMKEIHAEFSPEELLGVELVMQGKGSTGTKSIAGKALGKDKRRNSDEKMQAGTIACVSGFLINIPKKTIRMVSPTVASKEHPNGYYVFSSAAYNDPAEIEGILRRMVLTEDSRCANANEPIGLNKNYWIQDIGSQKSIRDSKFGIGMDLFNIMAPMLQSGKYSPNEIVKKAINENFDPLLSIKVMNELISLGMVGDSLRPQSVATNI